MRRLTGAAALALVLAGCGSGPPQRGLALRVGNDPFRLTMVRNGKAVVAENPGARLRFQLTSTGDQYKLTKVTSARGNVYEVGTSERGRTATVTVTRIPHGFHISLRLHPASNVQQVFDAFDSSPGEHFLGGGEHGGGVDLRGHILPLKVSYVCSAAPVPFFASTAGWGLRLDTENVAGLAFPGSAGGVGCQFGREQPCAFPPLPERTEVCVRGARLDEDLYAGNIPETLADYEAATGRPRVPPPSQLALVKWRDVVVGPAQVLEDVRRLRAAHIPIGWVLLDNPWEPCIGDLTFDTARIPDPAGLIRAVHDLGVRFMLWVSPKVNCAAGYPASGLLGAPGHQVLDLRQPAVVSEFRARLRKLVALGIDGVKGDRGDEVDLEVASPTLQNEYPLLFARAVLGALPRTAGGFFRAATVGSQQVLPGLWAGDQPGAYSGLQTAIEFGATAAMSGFPTWGSDIGGYSSGGLTADVFARWAQLGAVSPIMEVGGTGPNATPWVLGETAITALREAAVLHYELFPYLYGLLRRHQPVLRPLGYAFPDDPGAWQASLEFLVGPDLLAAPVVGGGETPSVYLPPGLWVDLHTGQRVKGPMSFTRPTPLTELPLYARVGAVLPFNLRSADSWWGVDELSHPGRAGYLVSDGSGLDLHGQPHDVQLFVPASSRPHRVTFDGRAVRWSWSPGPLPGVVIRVHGPVVKGEIVLFGA